MAHSRGGDTRGCDNSSGYKGVPQNTFNIVYDDVYDDVYHTPGDNIWGFRVVYTVLCGTVAAGTAHRHTLIHALRQWYCIPGMWDS